MLLRGVTEAALLVHTGVRVIEGDYPHPGRVLVGRLAHRKLGIEEGAVAVGKRIEIGGNSLEIGGVFEAPGTVMEGEIWVDLNQLMSLARGGGTVSRVVVRLGRDGDIADVDLFTRQRLDLELSALPEAGYYSKLSAFYRPLRIMTWITAIPVAVGAVFGGVNTLYAALASRVRELGALLAIWFSRAALFLSLLTESLLATLAGTPLASWLAVLALDGVTVPFLHRDIRFGGFLAGLAAWDGMRRHTRVGRDGAARLEMPATRHCRCDQTINPKPLTPEETR